MIERGLQQGARFDSASLGATKRADGVIDANSGAQVEIHPTIGFEDVTGSGMDKLLALLLVLTLACGMAAGVTISLAPAYADRSGDGY